MKKNRTLLKTFAFVLWVVVGIFTNNLSLAQSENTNKSYFRQLGQELPTPNNYRTASGAPGHEYWQQRADYDIKVELDDEKQRITGSETVTYTNNSPDPLSYIWLQLDQNILDKESDTYKTQTGAGRRGGMNQLGDKISPSQLKALADRSFDGGHKIQYVRDAVGNPLKFTIVKTMMRIDLPKMLHKGEKLIFNVGWYYNVNDRLNPAQQAASRGGCELFPEDGNWLYSITQWFPRMAVYDDYNGWNHKQFLGQGEFSLTFGNYKVAITVPSDHIVGATGELQNATQVLTATQQKLFAEARTAKKPVVIVPQSEVIEKEKTKSKDKKTWVYYAENVRDFAFTSSRKLIWDAMGVKIGAKTVMAMSYYPKEANPLYGQYSTEAVAHTLRVYSKYTFDYPYPVAISVEAANGMEYPMICFNYGRPEKDGTYSERVKYGMLGVVIHEVGHNFFPMIVNSDERHWTWMDEGLNTFLQFLAEQEWDRNYPSGRGFPKNIVDYMKSDQSELEPIMTNSESVKQLGPNAYAKPATALNILRETVMGRELFDHAFKEYSRRWMFKHPNPADFFRTMEDASGIDLDWFWRGWFYTTDPVDISIDKVVEGVFDTKNPEIEKSRIRAERASKPEELTILRNRKDIPQTAVESNADLKDFYNEYDPLAVTETDKKNYEAYLATLTPDDKKWLENQKYFYQVDLSNIGGLVMPVIIEFEFEDGTKEVEKIPAEIWRVDNKKISKIFVKDKRVISLTLDPYSETADIDLSNNTFPRKQMPTRFELIKQVPSMRGQSTGPNPMQLQKKEKEGTKTGGGK
jgi:hypothetical protein